MASLNPAPSTLAWALLKLSEASSEIAISQRGLAVPYIRRIFKRRTSVLMAVVILNSILLVSIVLTKSFPLAIILLVAWGLLFAARMPVRQAYLGVIIQPVLGKVADVWSYPLSYIGAAAFQIMSLPFVFLARRQNPKSDKI